MKSLFRDSVKKLRRNISILILLFVMWIILFEEITLFVVITGLIMPVIGLLLTDRFLLKSPTGTYQEDYMIGIWPMIKYFALLFYEIYVAGFGVIPNIISGESDTSYVSCDTKLTDEFLIDILANSVTLTPGTVTVHKDGQTFEILALDAPDVEDGEDPREALPLRLEAMLLEFEANRKEGK